MPLIVGGSRCSMFAPRDLSPDPRSGTDPPAINSGGQDTRTEQRPNGETRQLAGYGPAMEMFGFPGETLKWQSPNPYQKRRRPRTS